MKGASAERDSDDTVDTLKEYMSSRYMPCTFADHMQLSQPIKDIIVACISYEPGKRLSALEVVEQLKKLV